MTSYQLRVAKGYCLSKAGAKYRFRQSHHSAFANSCRMVALPLGLHDWRGLVEPSDGQEIGVFRVKSNRAARPAFEQRSALPSSGDGLMIMPLSYL